MATSQKRLPSQGGLNATTVVAVLSTQPGAQVPEEGTGTHAPGSSPLANPCLCRRHGVSGWDAEAGSARHAALIEHQHLELSQRRSVCPRRSPLFWSNVRN